MMHFSHFNGFEIRMFFIIIIKRNISAVYSLPQLMVYFIIVFKNQENRTLPAKMEA